MESTLLLRMLRSQDRERRRSFEESGFVYFVQAGGGPVKIGWSINVRARLGSIQTDNASECRLLGAMAGGFRLEQQLHAVFASIRIRGEWFQPSADLLAFVAEHAVCHDE